MLRPRTTFSKRVTGGTRDPVKKQEFEKRADATRRKKMREIMEREARIDQADHEPRKLIIINELIKYLNQKEGKPAEITYNDVKQIIVEAFGKIPNRKRREFKRIEDELRDIDEEMSAYKPGDRMIKSLAKEQGKLRRARIHSDHYIHSNITQAEVLTNEDKKLITDTLESIFKAAPIQKVIQNLKQRELDLRTKQHRFKMRSRKRKSSRKRKASRKRSRKRRSAKRKTSRKRRSAKRKTSRKRRSSKRKASRKRSRKRRSSKRCPAGCVKKKTSKRKSRKVKKS